MGSIQTFNQLFCQQCQQQTKKTVYSFLDDNLKVSQSITFHELLKKSIQIALLLEEYNVNKGDRAILLYPPGLDYIASFYGCLLAGVIAVPAYPPINQKFAARLESVVNNAEPKVILSSEKTIHYLEKINFLTNIANNKWLKPIIDKFIDTEPMQSFDFEKFQWLVTDYCNDTDITSWQPKPIQPDDIAFLQYTSGSTGHPKGVMVTQKNITANQALIKQAYRLTGDDIVMSWLPPYHDLGLIGIILQTIYNGGQTYLMSPMTFLKNPARWLQAMTLYQATASAAPNFGYALCCHKVPDDIIDTLDLTHWRVAISGAEPIHYPTMKQFYGKFKRVGLKQSTLHPAYGLAEATLLVSTRSRVKAKLCDTQALSQQKILFKDKESLQTMSIVSCGIPFTEVKIVNPNTRKVCQEKEIGEIWIQGDSVSPGYWQQPEENKKTFQAKMKQGSDTYLRTGDLGFLFDNELYINGRIKDIIIIHGYNYFPQDIEADAAQAHSAIKPGNIAAFTKSYQGEEKLIITAEIRKNTPKKNYERITKAISDIIMSKYELPVAEIALLPEHTLSKTTSGKIRRQPIKTAYLKKKFKILYHKDQTSKTISYTKQTDGTDKQPEVNTQFLNYIITTMQNFFSLHTNITADTHLSELGLDSVHVAELAAHIQQDFDIEIDFNAVNLLSASSVGEFANLIQALFAEQAPEKFNIKLNASSQMEFSQQEKELFSNWRDPALTDFNQFREIIALEKRRQQAMLQGAEQLYFQSRSDIASSTITLNDTELINFSSYNYLNLSGHPDINQAAYQAMKQYGTSASASRLVAGECDLHQALEQKLAEFIGTESTIVYVSGHGTNINTISHLFSENDIIFYDTYSHNSLELGAEFSQAALVAFPHNDINALTKLLDEHRPYHQHALIVVESIYSMDGDIADLPTLIKLKKQYNALLMIDEAHSIGTLGNTGRGICEYYSVDPKNVDILMGTLSKSLASCGGYIAGTKTLVTYLKYSVPGFVFSVGLSPSNASAALHAIKLIEQHPQWLTELSDKSRHLLALLQKANINTGPVFPGSPIIPIITGKTDKAIQLSLLLKQHNILALPIIYPAVKENAARVRFFINRTHTKEQLEKTANIIIDFFKA